MNFIVLDVLAPVGAVLIEDNFLRVVFVGAGWKYVRNLKQERNYHRADN